MRKPFVTSVPLFVVAALAVWPLATTTAPAADLDDVDALAWLAGCWVGKGGGGKNQECWTAPEGGIMLGVNRVISERGTRFEFLRIAPHGDGLAYFASPGGKEAVAFTLIESAPGLAVFANPWHDFPQRLTYRREGDALTARVEAKDESDWGGFDVAWRLAAGGWLVDVEPADE